LAIARKLARRASEADREELSGRVEQEGEVRLHEQLFALVGERLQPPHETDGRLHLIRVDTEVGEVGDVGDRRQRARLCRCCNCSQIADMAVHCATRRFDPRDEFAVGAISALCSKRAGHIGQRLRVGRQLAQSAGPGLCIRRGIARLGRRPKRFFEVPQADCLAPLVATHRASGLARQGDAVLDARQGGGDRKRLLDHLPAGIGQREQVPGEVAAVDRRHVRRIKPTQVARVVPVVEMAAIVLELVDRRQRLLQTIHHLEGADPTEVAR
jgi:hypothetical protein